MVTPDAPNGKGRSATDNVGVQYGLNALLRGQITPEQFVDLNSKVGGIDIDGNFTPERKAADPAALEILYEHRPHEQRHAARRTSRRSTTAPAFRWTTRASIRRSRPSPTARGSTARTATTTTRSSGSRGPAASSRSQFDAMRQWLDNLAADTSGDPQSVKVQRAKPADLVDTCFMAGGVQRRHDLQRHVAALRGAADRRGRAAHAGRDEVPDEAARRAPTTA